MNQNATNEVVRIRRKIRRNWILTAVFGSLAAVGTASIVWDDRTLSSAASVALTPLFAALGPYLVWATLWGVPPVWRWWREHVRGGKGVFASGASAAYRGGGFFGASWFFSLFLSIFFFLPVVLGYGYGALGGAIYEYRKARRVLAAARS